MVDLSPAAAEPHLESVVEHSDHVILHPKPRLKEKALTLVANAPATQDADMIARAQRAVEALEPSYAEWMATASAQFAAALSDFDASDKGCDAVQALRLAGQNLRGQAKQFGYTVVAQMATGLCEHLQGEGPDVPSVVLGRYSEAIASVIRAGVKDVASETALELARQLSILSAEFRSRYKAGA